MPLHQQDIIIIGLQPWYTPVGSNCKAIARQFARHNRVLYVNTPPDRRTLLTNREDPGLQYHRQVLQGKSPAMMQVDDQLWNLYPATVLESLNWLPSTRLFRILNRMNNRRLAHCIRAGIHELGFHNPLLFNDNDIFRGYSIKKLLHPHLYIYYNRDHLTTEGYWKKHGAVLEPQLIATADVCVANSHYLTERLKTYNPYSYYVGQGCDLEKFDAAIPHQRPADLPPVTQRRPLIGYTGALTTRRLGIGIIRDIAERKPEWDIVLVGPEDEDFRNSNLHGYTNIYFTGSKPLENIPAYIRHFDVCINPQLVNLLTIGNYPLKADEYLAMGKPLVATRTQAMAIFEEHTYLADTPCQYVSLIEQALLENSPARQAARAAFARTHSWENSVELISDAINRHLPEAGGGQTVSSRYLFP